MSEAKKYIKDLHMGKRMEQMTEIAKHRLDEQFTKPIIDALIEHGYIGHKNVYYHNLKQADINTEFIKAYKDLFGINPSEWFKGYE